MKNGIVVLSLPARSGSYDISPRNPGEAEKPPSLMPVINKSYTSPHLRPRHSFDTRGYRLALGKFSLGVELFYLVKKWQATDK
jgi:hypothetical protein